MHGRLVRPPDPLQRIPDLLMVLQTAGQGSFDLPHELTMDWNMNVELPASLPAMPAGNGGVPGLLQPASIAQPQPFAGPVSRLGWASNSPVPTAALPGQQNCGPPLSSSAGAAGLSGHHMGSPPEHGPMSQPPLHPFAAQGEQQGLMKPQFPAMPRSARRASVPATAPGGVSTFVSNTLYETRSSPPLWTIGEGEVDGSPGIHGGMRPALSADANTAANMTRGMDGASSAGGQFPGWLCEPLASRHQRTMSCSSGSCSHLAKRQGVATAGTSCVRVARNRNRHRM